MAVLSVVFFGLVVADLVVPDGTPTAAWLDRAIMGLWALFWAEFLLKLVIAPDKPAFLKGRWFDLLVLLFPGLRVFRALRAVRALRAGYSIVKLGLAMRRSTRALSSFAHQSRLGYVAGLTSVVVLSGAAAALMLEREAPASQIRTFGDALWWSAALVTTVASDLNPVTPWGRMLAVGMMVYGMTVFGYFVTRAVSYLQRSPD